METAAPTDVHSQVRDLLREFNSVKKRSLEDIIDLHQRFEAIRPFQDGNSRVGRLIMFKKYLSAGIVSFNITDDLKIFYYRGLRERPRVKGFLLDTCLTAQDNFKSLLDYIQIKYQK